MLTLILPMVLLAAPVALDAPHVSRTRFAPSELIARMTENAATGREEASGSNPWTGRRGRDRILGLSLTGTGGVLSIASLALFVTAASVPSVPYGYRYDPYLYGYGYPVSPVPYILAGLLSMGGAAACLAFGIPMTLRGFAPSAERAEPATPSESPRRAKVAPSTI
ncbi:MAG: hypothetical protein ACT4TC_16045 [Myxococcaceae bacterium]